MIEEKFDTKGFEYESVIKECESKKTIDEQLKYLRYVLMEWRLNPPRLDPNGEITPSFEKRLELQIENKEKELLLRLNAANQNLKTVGNQKIQLPEDDGLTDVVRIFTSMKSSEIIDKQTSVANVARVFCETEDEVKEFCSKYYASEKNTKDYKRNSNSKKLFDFICDLIKNAYDKKPDKLDELNEFLEKMRVDSYKK